MAKEILVPLTSNDRLAQFIPFIEQLGQPGMKVVLLMRYASNPATHEAVPVSELRSTGVFSSGGPAPTVRPANRWDDRQVSAEREVFLAGERLQKQGIKIVAHVYAGSLRGALKSYLRSGNVHLILKRARWYRPAANVMGRLFAQLGLFGNRTASRVMLLSANAAVS